MNVALTRAKASLFVLGNAPTLERSDDIWRKIVENARSRSSLVKVSSMSVFACRSVLSLHLCVGRCCILHCSCLIYETSITAREAKTQAAVERPCSTSATARSSHASRVEITRKPLKRPWSRRVSTFSPECPEQGADTCRDAIGRRIGGPASGSETARRGPTEDGRGS